MPIEGSVKTGDRVFFRGKAWYVRPNGTSTYLFASSDTTGTADATTRTYVLMRDGTVPAAEQAPKPITTIRMKKTIERKKDRIESIFFYVVRDLDSAPSDRRLKLGITGNVPAMLKAYHRRSPNDQTVLLANCKTERKARAIEKACKQEFAEFRVDKSEVYTVRVHEIVRLLKRAGFNQGNDGIFQVQ